MKQFLTRHHTQWLILLILFAFLAPTPAWAQFEDEDPQLRHRHRQHRTKRRHKKKRKRSTPPKSQNRSAMAAELRGLAQMVLQLRKQMKQMKAHHRSQVAKLKRQIRSLKRSSPIAPPRPAPAPTTKKLSSRAAKQLASLRRSFRALQRQVNQLQRRVASLRRAPAPQAPSHRHSNTKPKRYVPPSKRRKTRPNVTGREYAKGYYMLTFTFPFLVDSIEYKLDGMKTFRSTGYTHVHNPITGKNYPKYYIMTRKHLHTGSNSVWFRYRDAKGVLRGPFFRNVQIPTKTESDAALFVRYQWDNPIMRQLRYRTYRNKTYFFFFWASNPSIFRQAKYSIGSPSLHQVLINKGKRVGGTMHTRSLRPGKYSVYARFTLVNGFTSPLLEYHITVRSDGSWYNTHLVR
jgi:hypothetical protein